MVPDVGEILKNKVDTDFFWFCNGCFSKFWNICRPILFIKVFKPRVRGDSMILKLHVPPLATRLH